MNYVILYSIDLLLTFCYNVFIMIYKYSI